MAEAKKGLKQAQRDIDSLNDENDKLKRKEPSQPLPLPASGLLADNNKLRQQIADLEEELVYILLYEFSLKFPRIQLEDLKAKPILAKS